MTDKQRFIKLGWEILEHKYRYYVLDKPIIKDYDYDMLEKEYDKLAEKLGLPPTAADMVGFDEDRPACKAVTTKLHVSKLSQRRQDAYYKDRFGGTKKQLAKKEKAK